MKTRKRRHSNCHNYLWFFEVPLIDVNVGRHRGIDHCPRCVVGHRIQSKVGLYAKQRHYISVQDAIVGNEVVLDVEPLKRNHNKCSLLTQLCHTLWLSESCVQASHSRQLPGSNVLPREEVLREWCRWSRCLICSSTGRWSWRLSRFPHVCRPHYDPRNCWRSCTFLCSESRHKMFESTTLAFQDWKMNIWQANEFETA